MREKRFEKIKNVEIKKKIRIKKIKKHRKN